MSRTFAEFAKRAQLALEDEVRRRLREDFVRAVSPFGCAHRALASRNLATLQILALCVTDSLLDLAWDLCAPGSNSAWGKTWGFGHASVWTCVQRQ